MKFTRKLKTRLSKKPKMTTKIKDAHDLNDVLPKQTKNITTRFFQSLFCLWIMIFINIHLLLAERAVWLQLALNCFGKTIGHGSDVFSYQSNINIKLHHLGDQTFCEFLRSKNKNIHALNERIKEHNKRPRLKRHDYARSKSSIAMTRGRSSNRMTWWSDSVMTSEVEQEQSTWALAAKREWRDE